MIKKRKSRKKQQQEGAERSSNTKKMIKIRHETKNQAKIRGVTQQLQEKRLNDVECRHKYEYNVSFNILMLTLQCDTI